MSVDTSVGLANGKYNISEKQAQAILEMKLNKLTNLEQDTILNDYHDAVTSIKEYLNILSKPEELNNLMIKELLEMKKEGKSF